MFNFEQESGLSWFNPAFFENEEFKLVGIVVGLSLYHSTILDIRLPLVTYKKLLSQPVGLSDFAMLRHDVANGLQKLLDYDGDDLEDVYTFFDLGIFLDI